MGQRHHRSARVWHAFSSNHAVLPATRAFIHEWNEPYLPLPFQPKLVFICWPRGDGRLSWPRRQLSKRSAQDCYVMEVTVYQLLRPSRLTGQLETQQAMSVELTTSWAENHNTNTLHHQVARVISRSLFASLSSDCAVVHRFCETHVHVVCERSLRCFS